MSLKVILVLSCLTVLLCDARPGSFSQVSDELEQKFEIQNGRVYKTILLRKNKQDQEEDKYGGYKVKPLNLYTSQQDLDEDEDFQSRKGKYQPKTHHVADEDVIQGGHPKSNQWRARGNRWSDDHDSKFVEDSVGHLNAIYRH